MSIASEINRIQQNVNDSLTAVANKGVVVPSGSNSDDLPGLIAQIVSGSGSAITITDEEDSHGGIIRTITAVSLAGDTVSPATLLQGYTAHNSLGEAITGTATSGASARLQAKTGITPSTSSQTIRPDSGYDGLSSVQINAMPTGTAGTPKATKGTVSNHSISITPSVTNTTGYISGGTKNGTAVTVNVTELESGTKTITANGTGISVSGYSTVDVNVPTSSSGEYQAKTGITPTESSQTITPDSGYDALSSVQINAISSTYVGSGITRRSSTDLTASGAAVTVPAGYYSEQASKSVSTMTLPTSASSSATSGYASKATIGRSTSNQYINIPAGYNSAGGYYTISATPNGTATAPASISGSSATVSTGTNTLTLTKTVSVTPNVSTAGYISAGTAGNSSVSLTASVTTKAAATITPTKSAQTIAAGTYLTGAQTIAAIPAAYITTTDANAEAADIVEGQTAYVDGEKITGTLVINKYYTGSSVPASSLGNDGDIYIQQ